MTDPAPNPEELRELTPEEGVKVQAFPLPGQTPDAVVNRHLLAKALGKSLTTIDAWRLDGMPFESKGSNGKSYEYRLSVCYAWMCERDASAAARDKAAEEAAAQLRLALVGGGQGSEERARLTPKQQRELLETETAWMIAARRRGELITAEDALIGLEAAFSAIRDGADALPDRAGRELGLDGPQTEILQRYCDEFLSGAAAHIRELIGDDESDGTLNL